jgi:hypothetical protein
VGEQAVQLHIAAPQRAVDDMASSFGYFLFKKINS